MATKFLDKTGLSHFWSKIKAWCNAVFAPIVHTHTSYAIKHSYTTAVNAAKNWYRIANANTSQTDTTKPIHAQFILTAYNISYDAGYYERWFVNAEVFGRNAHIIILGNQSLPFSQARILYENTIADLDTNDRPVIDIYLNTVLANGATKIEIEEVYNSGWTFVNNGQISASSVPTGFESVSCSVRNNGVERSTYADYVSYLNRQVSNITAAFTLADSYLYRSRTLNCTGTFTITIPSINSGYMWCVIKNKNTSSGVITLHPSTTSVLIDGSNADITLQPMEYVCIHSAGANNYSLIADGRFSSKTVAIANKLGTATVGASDAPIYLNAGVPTATNSRLNRSLAQYVANGSYSDILQTYQSDNNNYRSCTVRCVNGDGYNEITLGAHNESNSAPGGITVRSTDGTIIATAPAPAANANDMRIATTKWVNDKGYITSSGSITGNAATASAVTWSGVTNKPTTISGYGITDAKIANGTITLGSNSITPLTSVPSHNQASNTINAMTGYSKPNSTSAITASDTLNQAIGKLEKAIDDADISNTVHVTGNEFIGGTKEFGNSYYDSTREGETDWESSSLIIRYLNYIKGSGAPSVNKHANLLFLDKIGNNVNWNGRLGCVESSISMDGTNVIKLVCYKNEIIDNVDVYDTAIVRTGYDSNGVKFASCPSTPLPDARNAATDILTRDWIPNDTRIVHTSNVDETIYGYKTFAGSVTIHRVNPYLNFVETDITRLIDNEGTSYSGIYFKDKDENNICNIISHTDSTGNWLTLTAFDNTENSPATLRVSCSADGSNKFISGPTPASNANGTQLITASWANSKYVNLTSAQSIGGVKTFINTPHIENDGPRIWFCDNDYTRNTNIHPYGGLFFSDKNDNTFADILVHDYANSNKTPAFSFYLENPTRTDNTDAMSLHWRYWGSPTNTALIPGINDTCYLGVSSYRWKTIYVASSSINYSDVRIKDCIENISEDLLDAWSDINWVQYKLKSSIKEKGLTKARIHTGLIAQDINKILNEHNVSADEFGFFCYDSWDEPVDNPNNDPNKENERYIGDIYSLRYEEALCIEAAYQRRKNKILENRISELEKQVSDMLILLQNLTNGNG